MTQNFRHPEILSLARRDGRVTVEGLAAHFGVTLQTIRRDLAELAQDGRLERVHGGAVLPSGTANIAQEARRRLNAEGKAAMAAACATRIPDGSALFLGIGTSTEALARALLRHARLLVVTNALEVAAILRANPDCETVLTGGTLRPEDGGLVGPMAAEGLARFKPDIAVTGCSAVDAEGDMLDFDLREVLVTQAALRQARRVWLMADHMKFARAAPARIAGLDAVDALFTDRPLPPSLAMLCRDRGTEVVIAAP